MQYDSWDAADKAVEEISQMNYVSLRQWCTKNGYTSPVLESMITYDSVLCGIYTQYGLEQNSEYNDEIEEEVLHSLLDYHNKKGVNSQLSVSSEIDESSNQEVNYIGPRMPNILYGCLFNNKSIFIVADNVCKMMSDCFIIVPIQKYQE